MTNTDSTEYYVRCPKCGRGWPYASEQAACISLLGTCFMCGGSGITSDDLREIQREARVRKSVNRPIDDGRSTADNQQEVKRAMTEYELIDAMKEGRVIYAAHSGGASRESRVAHILSMTVREVSFSDKDNIVTISEVGKFRLSDLYTSLDDAMEAAKNLITSGEQEKDDEWTRSWRVHLQALADLYAESC